MSQPAVRFLSAPADAPAFALGTEGDGCVMSWRPSHSPAVRLAWQRAGGPRPLVVDGLSLAIWVGDPLASRLLAEAGPGMPAVAEVGAGEGLAQALAGALAGAGSPGPGGDAGLAALALGLAVAGGRAGLPRVVLPPGRLSAAFARAEAAALAGEGAGDLARGTPYSRDRFDRLFAGAVGLTPRRYLLLRRLRLAQAALAGGAAVSAVASALGFCSPSHFSDTFRAQVGVSPAAWRRFAQAAA